MSETTPVTEEAPKAAKKKEAKTVRYISTQKHTISFDMLVRGETLQGQWSRSGGIVEFHVPANLVEAFETHWHFTSGNLKRAED